MLVDELSVPSTEMKGLFRHPPMRISFDCPSNSSRRNKLDLRLQVRALKRLGCEQKQISNQLFCQFSWWILLVLKTLHMLDRVGLFACKQMSPQLKRPSNFTRTQESWAAGAYTWIWFYIDRFVMEAFDCTCRTGVRDIILVIGRFILWNVSCKIHAKCFHMYGSHVPFFFEWYCDILDFRFVRWRLDLHNWEGVCVIIYVLSTRFR